MFMNYFLLFFSPFLVNKITVDPVDLSTYHPTFYYLKNRMGWKNLMMGAFEAGSKTGPEGNWK